MAPTLHFHGLLAVPSRLETPVSIFASVMVKQGKKPLYVWPLNQLFEYQTKNEELQILTQELRELKRTDREAYKERRKKILTPFVIGEWTARGTLKIAVPLLVFDIDGGSEDTYSAIKEKGNNSPYIYRIEQSLGGGARIYVWAQFPEGYRKEAYMAIAKHLGKVFGLPLKGEAAEGQEHIDTSTNDDARMWFPAHTPPELVYMNEDGRIWQFKPNSNEKAKRESSEDNKKGEYRYEFTEEEKVDDILRQITETATDITQGVNTWFSKILLPLAHHYGEGGRDLAHQVSRFHHDYSEKETDKEYTRALSKRNGKVTLGSFLHHALEQGIRYDANRIIEISKRMKNSASKQKGSKKGEGIKIMEPEEILEKKIPDPSGAVLRIQHNQYLCLIKRNEWGTVSNFIITPLYLLRYDREPKRIFKITNTYGDTAEICCSVKAMTANRDFAAIVEGKGNFVPSWTNSQFATIKRYLYQHEDIAEEITVLGHQTKTGYFAFANGVFDGVAFYKINDYGIVTVNGQRYFLPAFSSVNENAEKEFRNERKLVFQPGRIDFKTWARQLWTVFGENAIIGICFTVSAIFRDIIFRHINSFPLLYLFGPKGTGKTTFRNAFHRLFGDYGPNDAIGLESASSPKGFARKLAQVRNGLQPFEEYKNRIDPKLIGMLKNIYDGIGYERAMTTNDNRTHATLVNSSVILGGQEMPTKENALFSRVIMLLFYRTQFSEEKREEFRKLEDMIGPGLGKVLLEVVRHRDLVDKEFDKSFTAIYKFLRKQADTSNLEERVLNNASAILAPVKLLATVLDFPFSVREAFECLKGKIIAQHQYMKKTDEVNEFWNLLDSLPGDQFAENHQYRVVDDVLSLDLKRIFPLYFKEARQRNLNVLDHETLTSYLVMQPYFKKQKDGRKTTAVRMNDGKAVRCMQFHIDGMQHLELDFLSNLGQNKTF